MRPQESCAHWEQIKTADEPDTWVAVLKSMGIDKALAHASQHSKDSDDFSRHLHTWFDGFRTLRFVHCLRERHFSSIGLTQLLREPEGAELFRSLRPLPRQRPERCEWLLDSNRQLREQLTRPPARQRNAPGRLT